MSEFMISYIFSMCRDLNHLVPQIHRGLIMVPEARRQTVVERGWGRRLPAVVMTL